MDVEVTVMTSLQHYLSTFWGLEEYHDISRLTFGRGPSRKRAKDAQDSSETLISFSIYECYIYTMKFIDTN
jgi:hypothetical protein